MANERLEEIRQARLQKRAALLAAGQVPYPAEARRTHTLAQVNQEFEELQREQTPLVLVGRVTAARAHGGVMFVDLKDSQAVLQVQFAKDVLAGEFWQQLEQLDTGDWIEAEGKAIKTQRGAKTLAVTGWRWLAKSIRPLPENWFGLKDMETRFRQREVDLWLNNELRQKFTRRSQIINWLRQYLTQQGYLEVETPVLQTIAGGAAARPFVTHHNALETDLFLRIAPELYLKRLLVGGYEKIFEIARNFRNEGVDREHNPEFTMLELYWAYADYEDLMDFTEELLEKLVRELGETAEVTWQGHVLGFERPLKRVRYVELVSERLGWDIMAEKETAAYEKIFAEKGLRLPAVRTYAKLVDELYKELIRPELITPTIVYDYPAELQPLAKQKYSEPGIVEQFQLLAGGMELVKAYTEQNDPVEQRARFLEQQAARAHGDVEAPPIDESYLRALEYGMPPAAGWGLGIDRLVAILTDTATVRDTIMFPLLKPEK